ncbi:nucleoside hydrolase [Alphaproteobacteria bacterium LSUCC0684]
MSAQKIIIDTDPGIDDAMAIHYAFADKRLEVLGLTTIFGNVYVEQATRNALYLAEQAAYPAVVAAGAERPISMMMNPPSHYVHGDEGFGHMPAVKPSRAPDPRPAHIYLSETCRAHSGEVILCPVGPLTNIARLLDYDPGIVEHVNKLVIMGGAVECKGNVTPYAEANIWNDPHAADKVFAAGWDIDLIGLDITQTITCNAGHFQALAGEAPEIGGFLENITAFYIDFYHGVVGEHVCLMHDPTAVIAITNPELITFKAMPIEVITEGERIGQTIRAASGRHPVRVAMNADIADVRETFLDICRESDRMKSLRMKAE